MGVFAPSPEHWVGDGFYVRTVFHPQGDESVLSPFLLLDFSEPRHFEPAAQPRGVGEHPHRGFETVTFAFEGEVDHRDSAGGGGRIGPGDVQWMTAASGVVHEEKHSERLTQEGGTFSMAQLWVNLPAKHKMDPPRYQAIQDAQFPRVKLGAGTGRLVAGELAGQAGPAQVHSPMVVMDLVFDQAGMSELVLPEGWNVVLVALRGLVQISDTPVPLGHYAVMESGTSDPVVVTGEPGARVLVLCGEPIDEPVVAYGPFVMNSWDEIRQAMVDYQAGRMGRL